MRRSGSSILGKSTTETETHDHGAGDFNTKKSLNRCRKCGGYIENVYLKCPKCGKTQYKVKSKIVTSILALLGGAFGFHRIYLRKWQGFLFPLSIVFLAFLFPAIYSFAGEVTDNLDILNIFAISFLLVLAIAWADAFNLIRTKREVWDNKYKYKVSTMNWPFFTYELFLLAIFLPYYIDKLYSSTKLKFSTELKNSLYGFNAAVKNNNRGLATIYATKLEQEFKPLANNGSPAAQYLIGMLYETGYVYPQDYIKAREWYSRSANQNFASAQVNLGRMYLDGLGVPQNYEMALDLFHKASDQGDAAAKYNIGTMYENGYGVELDQRKAKDYLEQAANKGLVEAENNLGIVYYLGNGVEQDYNKAFYWISRAANNGLPEGEYMLGLFYSEGIGVSIDPKQAFIWFKKSAEKGDSNAQFNVAYSYQEGIGINKDIDQAEYWYKKAGEQGDVEAKQALDRLRR